MRFAMLASMSVASDPASLWAEANPLLAAFGSDTAMKLSAMTLPAAACDSPAELGAAAAARPRTEGPEDSERDPELGESPELPAPLSSEMVVSSSDSSGTASWSTTSQLSSSAAASLSRGAAATRLADLAASGEKRPSLMSL